jgi:hypothetical protein
LIERLLDNAGWCWYQDDRVIVDQSARTILFTSVATKLGRDGERRNGDIDVTSYNPAAGELTTVTVAKIPTLGLGDDHNAAALWQRPDGRYLAMCTGHLFGSGINSGPDGQGDTQPLSFFRISERPHDLGSLGPIRRFAWPSNDPVRADGDNDVTYSNLIYLSDEGRDKGRLYNIARAAGRTMHLAYSDDWGEIWTYGGVLSLPPGHGRNYSNGYFKFAGNGRDRIDFIATEAHPRDYNNGVYHGYIQAGKVYDAAGTVVHDELFTENGPPPEAFTPVFTSAEPGPWTYHHGWTTELRRGEDGLLYALFTTRYGTVNTDRHSRPAVGDADHRLFYAVIGPDGPRCTELAKMGPGLHRDQEDYTGLATIDPRDARTVYLSSNVDPKSGTELEHYELFRCRLDAKGEVQDWTVITENSQRDNLRPQLAVIDRGSNTERAVLLWLYGSYPHQREYDQAVMAKTL